MSAASPTATAMPIDRAARMVMYATDTDYDGKLTAADGAEGKAVLGLAGKTEMSFDDLVTWTKSFDTQNRAGFPAPDGLLDQDETKRLVLTLRQMEEHQNPSLSQTITALGASIISQVDANHDGKITAADQSLVARALLRLAGANVTSLDSAGMNALLTRYDVFDSGNMRSGPDGKLGPLEFESFQADLQAVAATLPATPAPAAVADATAGANGAPRRW